MSKRTRVGLCCGLAIAIGVGETFAANKPSDPDIDLAVGSKIEPNNPQDDLVGVTTIRIIGPDHDQELGTIMYDVPDNGLAPAHRWGGPR
jgi:hypothetical protein